MSTIERHRQPIAFPAGATDCHSHVVGPAEDRWPTIADSAIRAGTRAGRRLYRDAGGAGLSRCILVQPSIYGTDNSCQIEAMQEIGRDRCRGVAVVSPDVPNAELQRLHDAGMRGVRFNLRSGGLGLDDLETVCRKIAPFGWHAQIFTAAPSLRDVDAAASMSVMPIVIDHMGGPEPAKGLAQPGFQALLRLLADRVSWVKLSGAERLSGQEGGYDDVVPFARALIAAALEGAARASTGRCRDGRCLEPADWINQLLKYVQKPAGLVPVLVDNPAILYGFLRSVQHELHGGVVKPASAAEMAGATAKDRCRYKRENCSMPAQIAAPRIGRVGSVIAALLALCAAANHSFAERLVVAEGAHIIGYSPAYIAQEQGYFKDAGIDVDIVLSHGSAQGVAAVAGGSADLTLATASDVC